jgi:GNAT superfamily N-acetyltransferase
MKGKPPVPLTVDEVAHGNPYPDPLRAFRGTSWLNSVAREVMADSSMTNHKLKYFDNAATPNMLVTVEGTLSTQGRETFRDALNAKFGGWRNAWKTLVLEEGADAKIIGSNLGELAFGDTQAAGENRIAVASQVPSVVLGIKEGADQATYSNYEQALQHFANFTIQYLWTHAAATIGTLLPIPAGWSLYFDPANIPALQTDVQQDATIAEIQANTIRELIDAGFDPASVVDAVATGDMSGLQHSGLVSDQLQDQAETDADIVQLLASGGGRSFTHRHASHDQKTHGRKSAGEMEKALEKEFPGVDISLSPGRANGGNHVILNKIVVPKDQQGQGTGSKVMSKLTGMADEGGTTLSLDPSTDFGASSKARLVKFYKSHGFVENKGRNRDFEISEDMYREAS